VRLAAAVPYKCMVGHAPWPGGVYGRCHVSNLWPRAEQEQAGVKCLKDLFIMFHFVILSLKLLRIKSYCYNKSDYDRGNVVKCQNVVSL